RLGEGETGRRGDKEENGASVNAINSSSSTLSKNQRERLQKRIASIETEISDLEDDVAKLTAEMASPEVVADYEKFQVVSAKVQEQQTRIQSLYEEWDAASADL